MVYEKNSVRTLFTNQLVSLILNDGKPSRNSKKEKHTDFGVLSLEVESEGFTESYFLLAPDCHRTPLKICIGTLLLTQLIVTKKKPYSFFLIVESEGFEPSSKR